MIQDLDSTIKSLLQTVDAELDPPLVLRNAQVNFRPPTGHTAFTANTLNLYLYRTRENHELREVAPIITRNDGRYSRRRPPVRLDCEYIVTAWSTATDDDQISEEHELLAAAVQWLSSFPEIPESRLQGGLATAPFAHPALSAQMDGTGNIGEFWSSMGTPPRPSFDLVVTIALPRDQLDEGPLVITKEMRMRIKGQEDTEEVWFQIGGEVFNSLSAERPPVPDASVSLVGASRPLSETTDAQGRFSFTNLSGGDYVLEVTRNGYIDATKNITVPVPVPSGGTAAENYDVGLFPI